ncbi:unnamed protein product [Gongylonema pulchrum]|uniref:Helicase C-terminal domain-containing protein n=1 Tax=Gongylonema pulchrum TaxID=637853 RepID=A0A183EHU6_9BILA|nr:unnamed protein product [Gongylonema pulchrum]
MLIGVPGFIGFWGYCAVLEVGNSEKIDALQYILDDEKARNCGVLRSTLVFVKNKRMADVIAIYCAQREFPSISIHGLFLTHVHLVRSPTFVEVFSNFSDRNAKQRKEALEEFRSGAVCLLAATDMSDPEFQMLSPDHIRSFSQILQVAVDTAKYSSITVAYVACWPSASDRVCSVDSICQLTDAFSKIGSNEAVNGRFDLLELASAKNELQLAYHTLVINYDMPSHLQPYTQRIRFARSKVTSFVNPKTDKVLANEIVTVAEYTQIPLPPFMFRMAMEVRDAEAAITMFNGSATTSRPERYGDHNRTQAPATRDGTLATSLFLNAA